MARPEARALVAGALWCTLAIVAAYLPVLGPPVWVAGALLLLVALIDLLRVRRRSTPRVTRRVAASLPLRNMCPVLLQLHNAGASPLDLELYDHHPPSGEVEHLPQRVRLPAGGAVKVTYRFRPLERGAWRFGRLEMLVRSPWGLWRVRRHGGDESAVRVLPDFGAVRGYTILAVSHRTAQLGVRQRQRRGQGLELHQLRDYRIGDGLRQIDWKATCRRGKVISREYTEEQNQQLVFLLDCGRSMRARDDGVPHFDHALNGVLLLTHVALRQGDAVGLMTTGGFDRWIAPVKGPGALQTILEATYGLETTPAASDFSEAATLLMARQRRRALVVWVSNLRAEDAAELGSSVRLLRRRHLVLLASLRESVLDRTLEQPVGDFVAALRAAGTLHYLAARRQAHEAILGGRGLLAVDVVPADLPVALVNRYIAAKRDGLL